MTKKWPGPIMHAWRQRFDHLSTTGPINISQLRRSGQALVVGQAAPQTPGSLARGVGVWGTRKAIAQIRIVPEEGF